MTWNPRWISATLLYLLLLSAGLMAWSEPLRAAGWLFLVAFPLAAFSLALAVVHAFGSPPRCSLRAPVIGGSVLVLITGTLGVYEGFHQAVFGTTRCTGDLPVDLLLVIVLERTWTLVFGLVVVALNTLLLTIGSWRSRPVGG